jgi:hypothetical protein
VAREVANEVAPDELREFAEAGQQPAGADPGFEERLRQKLWRLLRQRLGRERKERTPLD